MIINFFYDACEIESLYPRQQVDCCMALFHSNGMGVFRCGYVVLEFKVEIMLVLNSWGKIGITCILGLCLSV